MAINAYPVHLATFAHRFLPQPFQVRSVPGPGRCRCQTLVGLQWHRKSDLYLLSPIAVLNYKKATKSWCPWRGKLMSLMSSPRKLRIPWFVMSVMCWHFLDIPELSWFEGGLPWLALFPYQEYEDQIKALKEKHQEQELGTSRMFNLHWPRWGTNVFFLKTWSFHVLLQADGTEETQPAPWLEIA